MQTGQRFSPVEFFALDPFLKCPDWFMVHSEIDLSVRVVYSHLIRASRGRSYTWPFMKNIARAVGVSEKTVERAIKELERLKLIQVERPEDRTSLTAEERAEVESKRGNRYFFLWHEWMPALPTWETDSAEPEGAAAPTDTVSVGQQTPSLLANRQHGGWPTDRKSVSLTRESEETSRREKATKSAGASRAADSQDISPSAREGINPHRPEQRTEDAATAELTSADFDLNAKMAEVQANIRRQRAEALAAKAGGKTIEAHAKKLAKRSQSDERRKARAKAEVEMGAEPVEVAPENPRSRLLYVWREEMKACFPEFPVARQWSGKEWGVAEKLLESYDRDQVEVAVVYVIRNWEALRERFFKGKGGPVPTLGVIQYFSASLLPESVVWAAQGKVVQEYEAYGPAGTPRPLELQDRYFEAVRQLKAIGLET